MIIIDCRSKGDVLRAIESAAYENGSEVKIACGTFEMTFRNPASTSDEWFDCVYEARKKGLRRLYRKVKTLPQKLFKVD